MRNILVVDDEKDIRDAIVGVLKDEGFHVEVAGSAEEALKMIDAKVPDLVFLDIWLPGIDGIETLKRIKDRNPGLPVVMISGHASIETAVKTTKLGAYDFIEKPLSLDKLILTLEHALELKQLTEENMALKQRELSKYEIIGNSGPMESLRKDINRVAPTNSWVLITGENGTGKEFVARNIYLRSNRAARPFIEVNCAAIPEELIESELFGYEKGAFTNALARKKGKFDMADTGTIFLDEIGDMSLKTQAKMLRILQEQSFERVGGTERITVDVRVIAATNKDLLKRMQSGDFREDLYYRLNVIPLHVPLLRERASDIPLFVEHFLVEFSKETDREVPTISKDAMGILLKYGWPGNIRELKNLIERLVIMTQTTEITPANLPSYILGAEPVTGASHPYSNEHLKEARRDFEREFIHHKLKEFKGNISRTAEAIGIERSHLYRKIKSYGIEYED